ncbi:MAG: glycerol-3-phosphate 1-O-acyltransferase PlsY [Candidatus Binatia bacterium]
MFVPVMTILLTIFGYLVGSIPSGFILGKLAGVDVRDAGSGNIGATNVARVLGKGRGLLTLLADTAKGFVPVFIGERLGLGDAALALVAIAAFLGHLYPVFLKFQGGKGVATAFGALLAVAPLATPVMILAFGLAVLCSRRVSLGSIAAALAAPISLWAFSYSVELIAMSAFLGAMVILRHRDNIKRVLGGTEPRFGANSR